MESLLNEMKLNFKRGQRIKFYTPTGEIRAGSYVMAGSAEGYIVLNMGGKYGTPKVIPISAITPTTNYGEVTVKALRRMK